MVRKCNQCDLFSLQVNSEVFNDVLATETTLLLQLSNASLYSQKAGKSTRDLDLPGHRLYSISQTRTAYISAGVDRNFQQTASSVYSKQKNK